MAMSSSSTPVPIPDAARRLDLPIVQPTRRGRTALAMEAADSAESKDQAINALLRDEFALSYAGPPEAYWHTWLKFHRKYWAPEVVPVLPLTLLKIRGVSALLKHG